MPASSITLRMTFASAACGQRAPNQSPAQPSTQRGSGPKQVPRNGIRSVPMLAEVPPNNLPAGQDHKAVVVVDCFRFPCRPDMRGSVISLLTL